MRRAIKPLRQGRGALSQIIEFARRAWGEIWESHHDD
jgi:hypothetical protein